MTMSTPTIAQIITEARERLGLNQSELARRLSITPQSVQAWESGRSVPRPAKFQAIARALGIRGEALLKASGMMSVKNVSEFLAIFGDEDQQELAEPLLSHPQGLTEAPHLNDDVFAPLLQEVELSAAPGKFAIEEDSVSRHRFSKGDLRAKGIEFGNAKFVIVSGSSMLPVLRDGAIAGVNAGKNQLTDVVDGEMYAISHNGQLRIKQVFRLPGGLRLRSFNRNDHPDEDYSFIQLQDEQIRILGHVFWWGMFA
jgi:phage repressor protein C with HTH and peptisase S24 domain